MIGIIGGTGLGESLGALGAGQSHTIETPFGMPFLHFLFAATRQRI